VRAGTVALVGGVAQVFVTLGIGYAVGIALAWPSAQALFFGAVVAISSSAVLSKIIDEHGDGDSEHGRIALAWSTVQDFATIALVVSCSRSWVLKHSRSCDHACETSTPWTSRRTSVGTNVASGANLLTYQASMGAMVYGGDMAGEN
jgi:predicted Kef-type K+ transport protein